MKGLRKFKKGDLILVVFIGIIVSIPLLWNFIHTSGSQASSGEASKELIAVVTRDGKRVAEVDLNKVTEPQYIHLEDGIQLTVEVEKGRIRVLDADCPDKICVKYGWLTKPGDQAICLPSKTIVKIQGEGRLVSFLAKRVIIDE